MVWVSTMPLERSSKRRAGSIPVVMTGCLVLCGLLFVFMTGRSVMTLRSNARRQAADALALSVARLRGDLLNNVSIRQMRSAELVAWSVLPAALTGRGPRLDPIPATQIAEDAALSAKLVALGAALTEEGRPPVALPAMAAPVHTVGACGDSELTLKSKLVDCYETELSTGVQPLVANELQILEEWNALLAIEKQNQALTSEVQNLVHGPIHQQFATVVRTVAQFPATIKAVQNELESRHGYKLTVYTGGGVAVLVQEPHVGQSEQSLESSELIAGSWPWVAYHARPVRERLAQFPISQATYHFDKWLLRQALERAHEVYTQLGQGLFILPHCHNTDRGHEPWRNNTQEADHTFSVLALASGSAPVRGASGSGRAGNSPGLAQAQALVMPGPTLEATPRMLWDTLPWDHPVAKYPNLHQTRQPRATPRWEARLVRATLLSPAIPHLPKPVQAEAQPYANAPRSLFNH